MDNDYQYNREERTEINLPVKCCFTNFEDEEIYFKGVITNISKSGAYLKANEIVDIEDTLNIKIKSLDGDSFDLTAVVKWNSCGFMGNDIVASMGIMFLELSEEDLQHLGNIVENAKK